MLIVKQMFFPSEEISILYGVRGSYGENLARFAEIVYHFKTVFPVKRNPALVISAYAEMHAFYALFVKIFHKFVHKRGAVSLALRLGQNIDMKMGGVFFCVH